MCKASQQEEQRLRDKVLEWALQSGGLFFCKDEIKEVHQRRAAAAGAVAAGEKAPNGPVDHHEPRVSAGAVGGASSIHCFTSEERCIRSSLWCGVVVCVRAGGWFCLCLCMCVNTHKRHLRTGLRSRVRTDGLRVVIER